MKRRRVAFQGWWAAWLAGGMAAAQVPLVLIGLLTWLHALMVICLAAFVVAVCALAESQMALQAIRLRALETLTRGHARELTIFHQHEMLALAALGRVDPTTASRFEAALNLDLNRLHALGAHTHRQETDA